MKRRILIVLLLLPVFFLVPAPQPASAGSDGQMVKLQSSCSDRGINIVWAKVTGPNSKSFSVTWPGPAGVFLAPQPSITTTGYSWVGYVTASYKLSSDKAGSVIQFIPKNSIRNTATVYLPC